MQYITDLRADDVLLGRGSGPNDHEGNIRFRQLVADRKNEYMATNHRLTKAKIAQEIVDKVYANNGRFLRKLENEELLKFGVPDGVDAWAVASDETIMEKAKQALRQNSNRPKSEGGAAPKSASPKPPASLPIPLVIPVPPSVEALDDFEPIPLSSAYPSVLGDGPVPVPLVRSEPMVPVSSVLSPDSGLMNASSLHDHTVTPPPESLGRRPAAWGRRSPPPPPAMAAATAPPAAAAGGSDLDAQDDSILSHLPPHLRAQFLQNAGNSNNESMSHIPNEDFGAAADNDPYESRRGSMTMTDLARYHRRRDRYQASEDNMSVVMDSFSKMKTSDAASDQQHRKMYASTETMGTIEPIGTGSMADMSFATMNSSTFSVFRGNESTFGSSLMGPDTFDRPISVPSGSVVVEPDNIRLSSSGAGEAPNSARPSHHAPPPAGRFETSFSHTELPVSRTARYHAARTNQHIIHEGSESTAGDDGGAAGATAMAHPRPVRLMEDQPDEFHMGSMGLSSMEILKSAFQSSTDWDIPVDDPSLQAPAESLAPRGAAAAAASSSHRHTRDGGGDQL